MTEPTSDQRRPFLSAPNPKRYFAAGAIEDARQRIVRAIARNEGPAMLVGGAGTGKSLLLEVLGEQFAGRMSVVELAGAQLCTRRALLQVILAELGLPFRGLDEGELRLAILQFLRGVDAHAQADVGMPRAKAKPRRVLLLVDEAESLPVRLLEELRALTNVAAEGLPLVSLVLAGGPILEERFADPQLDMFAQRIAARCYLAPLSREETLQYVSSQVTAAGMKPERLFTADALEAIHAATGGVPRMINQLGDQLVWMAQETGCTPLDAALVQQAWSELQQLPAPWNTEGHSGSAGVSGPVVEFGELDSMGIATLDGADDAAIEIGRWQDAEDEMPASIPIASARPQFSAVAADDLEETFETAERLLESFDQFQELELSRSGAPAELASLNEPPDASPVEAQTPTKADRRHAASVRSGPTWPATAAAVENAARSGATDPFAEAFEEEEVVLDPYAAFEAELLRSAPQVINRVDRAFAGELHRCVQRAAARPKVTVVTSEPADSALEAPGFSAAESPTAIAAMTLPTLRAEPVEPRELLLIEDDEEAVAAVVPGKQFRRLFSRLEAGTGREAWA